MANYKSQYTGEQIDEAIGKVLNAPNIYNYDGTVIIEKAESVLGLRRFKETLVPIITVSENDIRTNLSEYLDTYGFDIEPNVVDEATITKLACLINVDGATSMPVILYSMTYSLGTINDAIPLDDFTQYFTDGTFTVTATSNSTVDEWLLANTEGVSV